MSVTVTVNCYNTGFVFKCRIITFVHGIRIYDDPSQSLEIKLFANNLVFAVEFIGSEYSGCGYQCSSCCC